MVTEGLSNQVPRCLFLFDFKGGILWDSLCPVTELHKILLSSCSHDHCSRTLSEDFWPFLSQFLSLSVCLAAFCHSVDKCVFQIICIIRSTLGSVPTLKATQNIKEAHFTELNTLSRHRRHTSHCLKPPDEVMADRWCGMVRG